MNKWEENMRTLLVALFLLLFFIISLPLFLIEIIIGKKNKKLKVKTSQSIVVSAFRIILRISGVKKEVKGLDNIPKDEAVLYVSNHRSYFDILVGYTSVPTLTGFVSKKEIEKIPILRVWMRYLNCLFLDRDNIREGLKTILRGIELIEEGYSIFIAPEGTRNQEKEMLPFKEGSFKMAEKTACAIIPVAISNTDNVFENHTPFIRPAHVIIEFGKPIYPNDLDKSTKKFLGAHVQSIIQEMLTKNEELIRS